MLLLIVQLCYIKIIYLEVEAKIYIGSAVHIVEIAYYNAIFQNILITFLVLQDACETEGKTSCRQPCPKKREDCDHPCTAPCHPDDPCPKVPCKTEVRQYTDLPFD